MKRPNGYRAPTDALDQIASAYEAHKAAAQKLAMLTKQAYPVGTMIRIKTGRGYTVGTVIDAGCTWSTRYPDEIRIRNTRTLKSRGAIYASHTTIEIISYPQP